MAGALAGRFWTPVSSSYDADAAAWFAAMSSPPDDTRKALYNTFVVDLKSAGVWELTDIVYLLAAHDAQAARLNGKAPSTFTASAVNSPTFTTDRGYQGDGSTSYLTTGFTANQAGSLYSAQNSAALAAYSNASGNSERAIIGDFTTGAELIFAEYAGKTLARIHAAAGADGASTSGFNGFYAASRLSSSVVDAYKDAATGTNAVSSTAPTSTTIYICAGGGTYYNGRVPFAWIGGGLTSTQVGNLRTITTAFLTAIGAN